MEGLFCTFYLANFYFGVPVERVQEILRPLPITPVPLAKRELRGLLNLRGQIVTAIDLRRRLALESLPPENPAMNLVIQTPDGPVSLLVDKVSDVFNAKAEDFEKAPDTLKGPTRDLTVGAFKLANQLLLILDVEKAVALNGLTHALPPSHPHKEFP